MGSEKKPPSNACPHPSFGYDEVMEQINTTKTDREVRMTYTLEGEVIGWMVRSRDERKWSIYYIASNETRAECVGFGSKKEAQLWLEDAVYRRGGWRNTEVK